MTTKFQIEYNRKLTAVNKCDIFAAEVIINTVSKLNTSIYFSHKTSPENTTSLH